MTIQVLPILVVAAVLAADAGLRAPWLDPVDPRLSAWAALAPLIAASAAGIATARTARRRRRVGAFLAADRLLHRLPLLLLAGHLVALLVFDWLGAVRGIVGDVVGLDEGLAAAPPLLGLALLWWLQYPLERELREAMMLRRLDEGRPVYPTPSRRGFVAMRVRFVAALALAPVLLALVLAESAHAAVARLEAPPAWLEPVVTVSTLLGVLVLAPGLARLLLPVAPLAAGPVRGAMIGMCRRHGVVLPPALVWDTGGTMANAAVLGSVPGLRYLLVTDVLLDALEPRQVLAVLAHEVGHLRHRHLPWLVAAMVGVLLLVSLAGALLAEAAASLDLAGAAPIGWTLLAGTLAAALATFGWVSRRFEWQADAFAARLLAELDAPLDTAPRPAEAVMPADAVETVSGTLEAVAQLNGADPARRDWRHGSIRVRQAHLRRLAGRALDDLPPDRVAGALKLAALGVLLLAGAGEAWLDRPDAPPTTPELPAR